MRHVLVLADSLAFYGPERGEISTDPRLFPNVLASRLSTVDSPVTAEVVARVGWTSRDVWWAMTRDPYVYSVLLARADAVVLAVGGMDYLPTTVPTWLREGIRYLRPPALRRAVRTAYQRSQPVAALHTPWRALPQALTDKYLANAVGGVRFFHPEVPVVGILPPPHQAAVYGCPSGEPRGHGAAVAAARVWGRRLDVPMVDLPRIVWPHLLAGRANQDGMHYGWETHAEIGAALAEAIAGCWDRRTPAGAGH